MEKPKIEFVTCEGGDWEVLKINEKVFEANHVIDYPIWIEFLKELGFEVVEAEISDEDMEKGIYQEE